jgi:hypothetical protein
MIEQEYIMLIMNCKKYVKKAAFQKRTWLPLIPSYLKFYHVIGDETMSDPYRFDDENQILWVRIPDDYNSLPKKVITAYEAVFNTFQFNYLFKTDDDQILVNQRFFDMLTGLITKRAPKPHYGGFIVNIDKPYLSQYNKIHPELPDKLPLYVTKYCSGRFYFLSRSAISNLLNRKDAIYNEYLEDYAIGFHLNSVFKENILQLATNQFFTDIELSHFPKWVEEGKI